MNEVKLKNNVVSIPFLGLIFGKLLNQLSYLFQQRLASLQYIPVSFHRQQALDMIGKCSLRI